MAEKKCEMEVTLVELTLLDDAQAAKMSHHLLGATLVWPRVGTARKTHSTSLPLALGNWSHTGRPWTQRVLFKETVQGRFGFEVTLTEALSDKQAASFMRSLTSEFVKLTVKSAEGHLTPPLLGSLAEIPFDYLVKALLKEQAPATLASGVLDLDSNVLPASGQSVRWEIPLLAPDGLFHTSRRRVGKTVQRKRETLIPVGGPAGRCVIDVRIL